MTFQSSGLTPGRASVYLDDDSIPLYSNGGTVLQGSATFSKSDEMELMEIFVNYDSFPSEQNVDFSISVNVRENRKNADIAIYPPENNYDKTTGVFLPGKRRTFSNRIPPISLWMPELFSETADCLPFRLSRTVLRIASCIPASCWFEMTRAPPWLLLTSQFSMRTLPFADAVELM